MTFLSHENYFDGDNADKIDQNSNYESLIAGGIFRSGLGQNS